MCGSVDFAIRIAAREADVFDVANVGIVGSWRGWWAGEGGDGRTGHCDGEYSCSKRGIEWKVVKGNSGKAVVL